MRGAGLVAAGTVAGRAGQMGFTRGRSHPTRPTSVLVTDAFGWNHWAETMARVVGGAGNRRQIHIVD